MNININLIDTILKDNDFKIIRYYNTFSIYEKRLKHYNDILEILIDFKKPDNVFEFKIFLNDETKVFEGDFKKQIKDTDDFKKAVVRVINFADDFTLFYRG